MSLKNNIFIRNTVILTATSLFLNVISMAFRVYLSTKIGATGLGLFALIISVFFFASTLACSGISLAVTRLVSESTGSGKNPTQVLYNALILAIILGSIASILLFSCANFVSLNWICDERAIIPLKILSLSLPFFSISVCFGGYFMAKRRIRDICEWQIADQVFQILATVLFLSVLPEDNIEIQCCGIVAGSAVGEAIACVHGFLLYDKKKEPCIRLSKSSEIYKNILTISVPIAISSYFRAGLSTLENMLIPKGFAKLKSSKETALAEYGVLKGMAIPAVAFPSAVLGSFSSILIPEIAEAAALKDTAKIKRLSAIAIRGCIMYSILILFVFFTFGMPLGYALFKNEQSGFILKIIAWTIPFMYLDSVADGILKAVDQQLASLRYNTIEGITRIVLIYALIPIYGITGFIVVVFVSNMCSSLLGLFKVLQVTKIRIKPMGSIIYPSFFGLISSFFAKSVLLPFNLNQTAQVVIGIVVLCTSYCGLIWLFDRNSLKAGENSSPFTFKNQTSFNPVSWQ